MKFFKRYVLFILIILLDVIILFVNKQLGIKIFINTTSNFLNMLGVIPPIFLLLGLLDTWVPRETIIKYLGEKSGIKGVLLSIFLGSAAAGPLYGAFPVAEVMIKKGAKFSNILIFLGAWSTLKIPMFLFEMTSLGTKFAITRWIVDVIGIILIAVLTDKLINSEEKQRIYSRKLWS
ncbi:permease [Caldicellulosiruptor changbaiensis]|uniref:Permease n=1 Tax=Caldicellulosiruptor changbaiensis TaxID=1222016 RepID=A0A3T0D6G2_9FIRM|nr:permease [Caldicellulosiruptor changbaiensis]AZT90649.1 permease [Caldicellulosiruptor changbaiensis]